MLTEKRLLVLLVSLFLTSHLVSIYSGDPVCELDSITEVSDLIINWLLSHAFLGLHFQEIIKSAAIVRVKS